MQRRHTAAAMASRKRDRTRLAAAGAMSMSAALLSSALLGDPARAEPMPQPNAAEIAKRLQRLSVVGSVLYVAAHPDDENTALLTYLAAGRGVRAVYLSMTRGDGGQNLIGAEQGIALGIIRTQELLAARRIDGAEQLFTRARDFGYSKSVEETLKIWGEDEILADTVLAIRRVRPDLIITRFSPDGGGHGHHTASAKLAVKAFKLAADPKYQPAGQPKLPPWQARRILVNRGVGGDGAGTLRLDIGSYDALLGVSYGELSGASRSMHKSQGFGAMRRRGPINESFAVLAEAPGVAPLKGGSPLAGLDWSWRRVPGSERIAQLAAEAARGFRFDNPAASIPALLALDLALEKLGGSPDADHWRLRKRAEVARLVAACAGLHLEGVAAGPAVVPGQAVNVAVTALNRSAAAVKLIDLAFTGPALAGKRDATAVGKALAPNDPLRIERAVTAAAGAEASAPYWLRQPPLPGRFQLADASLTGAPENPGALVLEAQVEIGGRRFTLASPVFHRWTDPVDGELSRPLEVVPAVSVSPQASALLFPDGKPQPLKVRLKGSAPNTSGVLKLEAGGGFTTKPTSVPFKLAAAGDEIELAFAVQPPRSRGGLATLKAIAEVAGRPLAQRLEWIQHDHIPTQMMLTPAEVRLVPVDLRRDGQRIGYVPGAGDEVAGSLERVGYQVVVLDEAALAAAPLGGFDAIVLGVRAFNTNDRLRFHRDRLLDYVQKGGTLVVQYNTNNRQARLEGGIGPLPFDIGRDRVTDETAPVAFEQPRHPLLNHPNKITAADFEGWVQERGLYFASNWDKGYETPLAMADPGEGTPSKGSLLFARHGKGTFIYTGLAFFRQLPAGVPGAYRLFANLIAHGKPTRK